MVRWAARPLALGCEPGVCCGVYGSGIACCSADVHDFYIYEGVDLVKITPQINVITRSRKSDYQR